MSSSRKSSGQVFGPIDGVATGGHPGEARDEWVGPRASVNSDKK